MNHSAAHKPPYRPLSSRSGPSGNTTITTFNLYNLFEVVQTPSGPSSPQALAIKIAKLVLALRYELLLPDIIIVQEVESEKLLQKAADAVNETAGTAYRAASPLCSDGRGIQVGFLWDERRVERLRTYQLSGPAISAAFGRKSPSPGREPLVGHFRLKGQELIIVANHFKSDYSGDAEGAEKKRLLRASVAQRRAQAFAVRDFVNTLLEADADTWLIVGGDFNQAPPTPPEAVDPGSPLAILQGRPREVPLTNLLLTRPDRNNYTFISDGWPVILDHLFASPALMNYFTAVDVLHFNVAHPEVYQTDPSTPCRVSDHDPLEARFTINENN